MKPSGRILEIVAGPSHADPEVDRVLIAARKRAEPAPENRVRISLALRAALAVRKRQGEHEPKQ